MNFTKQEFLFASLVGGKLAESIPRFSLIQNELAKHALPLIPFVPYENQEIGITTKDSSTSYETSKDKLQTETRQLNATNWEHGTSGERQFFPLTFVIDGLTKFQFPFEPMITLSSKNIITKRYVAKPNNAEGFSGSIKERYSQDDWSITITGVLIGTLERRGEKDGAEVCFPKDDFTNLINYCIKAGSIQVECELFQYLGINHIVIEDFSFPFSKGENVQAYEIKAVSDFGGNILTQTGN